MGRTITPLALKESAIQNKTEYSINDLVSEIALGKYALIVGHEVILDTNQNEFKGYDSETVLIDAVVEQLEIENPSKHVEHSALSSFSDVSDHYGIFQTKKAILKVLNPENHIWNFDTADVNPDLRNLLQSGVFRTIIVTSFDPYVENVLREKWGNNIIISSLWDIFSEQGESGFSNTNASKRNTTIYDAPRLYYAFGKADYQHPERLHFVVSDKDRLLTIQRLLSLKAGAFLKDFEGMHLLSLGNKMEDWLFRFFWYALTQGLTEDESYCNKVVHTFDIDSDSDTKLKVYLKKIHVLLSESEQPRSFLHKLSDQILSSSKKYVLKYNKFGGVFISYAHEDRAIALRLYNDLINSGFDVWMDVRLQSDSALDYEMTIMRAISEARVFVPVLSHNIARILQNKESRFVVDTEWRCAYQFMSSEDSNVKKMELVPVAVLGYDERELYHRECFENVYFSGVKSTIIPMNHSTNGTHPFEYLKQSLSNILRR